MVKANPSPANIRKAVYERIAQQDDISKAELMAKFTLTGSSLTRLLEELVGEGWISESGLGQSTGGRRPILYQINPAHRYIFGLEISRLYSSLGLFDMKLNALSHTRWTMDETMTPERLIQYVQEQVEVMLEARHVPKEQVLGIGIGAVGPLDRNQGVILNPLYFPADGWSNVPICRLIEEKTGIPAQLDNGANAALAGEHWALRGENIQHMLYVHAGTGLRSAMMSGGQLVYGAVDMEGSIGQMIIQADGPRLHGTGNYGALEAFASVQALEQQVRTQVKMGRNQLKGAENIQPEAIHFGMLTEALHNDELFVHELFSQSAAYMGIGLANLINILHPELIVLGGALINAHGSYYDTAVSVAQKNIYYYPEYQPVFSKGMLQENAVAVGAAVLVLKQLYI
ncbi:ROK family protein [Paenibacillus sp. P96]|uniref:ROK family protein n=1 Tax=Paenibacillus zeirhizosphaerae TaxID=2987519 RepID=A0ABT9FTW5_9BACL|nr:ROK family protein [Paenibacillus sp. P96]MDP4098140.1 ROK family protein [Paenibacillus sp. P96]